MKVQQYCEVAVKERSRECFKLKKGRQGIGKRGLRWFKMTPLESERQF